MSSKVCRTETESPVKRCARTGPTKSQKITEKPNTISFFLFIRFTESGTTNCQTWRHTVKWHLIFLKLKMRIFLYVFIGCLNIYSFCFVLVFYKLYALVLLVWATFVLLCIWHIFFNLTTIMYALVYSHIHKINIFLF